MMARVYGFLGGVVIGLSTVYASVLLMQSNTAAIHRELRHADDLARDRPRRVRPYTDAIDLQTQSFKDTFADLWNGEIIKGMNYLYSLKSK